MPKPSIRSDASPETQLRAFIAKFEPSVAALARGARRVLRRRFRTAMELVYDNYNALAIGWGATERTSDIIVSLAVYPSGVILYFMHGAKLSDPTGLLEGSGRQGRFLRLTSVTQIDQPAVAQLLDEATAAARTPLPPTGKSRTIIKSVSAKQRPRRQQARQVRVAKSVPRRSASRRRRDDQ